MSFFSQFFSQPGMLFGTLLVGVPIIIYLINRQRYQRRQWAAMEFLLRALQKNRRRLQLENLLLLLLRCLIIALVVAAMARPFVRNRVLGSLSTEPENWIFALDTSYSMGLKDGPRSLFEVSRESVSNIFQVLVKPGDRVSVVTISGEPRVVVPPRQITDASRAQIREELARIETDFRAVNLPGSLQNILDVAREFAGPGAEAVSMGGKKLVLFSDFQRKDWLGESGPRDPAVNVLLKEMRRENILFSRASLVRSDRNLTVVGLRMSPLIASVDVWVQFTASVRNFGKEDFDQAELAFHVDGELKGTHVVRVPAGGTVSRVLPYRFTDRGHHSVMVEVRGDDLFADNQRFLSVEVRESADVLLVDGEPGRSLVERETLLLELALLPEESDELRKAPYRPVARSLDQVLGETPDFDEYVVVVLANVSAGDLNQSFMDELRRYVRDGGSLIVFSGKNVVVADYERVFRRDPVPLMPLGMLETVRRVADPVHFEFASESHPLARYFLDRRDYTNLGQGSVEISGYVRFQPPPENSPVETVLSFTDFDRSPAVFDAPYHDGRVMWIATTADFDWNDFGKYWDLVPFLHESIPYLVHFGEDLVNLRLGEPFRQMFEASDYAPEVLIVPPRPREQAFIGLPSAIPKQLKRLSGDNRFVLAHEETLYPGIYEVRIDRPGAGEGGPDTLQSLFAVNLDPAEGDLRLLSRSDIDEHFPDFQAEIFEAADRVKHMNLKQAAASGKELWRFVLWMVLLFLITESFLAYRFGKRLR